jgi:hypothetical protein
MIYQLYKTCDGQDGAMTTKDNGSTVSFIFDPANTDYQEYLKWVAEGNEPLPADEV